MLTASCCGRKRGGPETDPPSEGRSPGRSRRRSPKDAGAGGGRRGSGRSRAPIGASRCEAGFHETSMAGTKGSSERGGTAEPAKVAGIAPRPEPTGRRRRASAPSCDPNGVHRRGFGLGGGLRESGKALGRRRDPKGDRKGFGPDANPRRRCGFGRAGSAKGSDGGASALQERPDGDRRGAFGPPRRDPPGPERGFAASLRDPGKAVGALRPAAIPKPPSERWPRHPATAVKAGTSGGRWRHRPPLLCPARPPPGAAHLAPLLGPQAQPFLREGTKARSNPLRPVIDRRCFRG